MQKGYISFSSDSRISEILKLTFCSLKYLLILVSETLKVSSKEPSLTFFTVSKLIYKNNYSKSSEIFLIVLIENYSFKKNNSFY